MVVRMALISSQDMSAVLTNKQQHGIHPICMVLSEQTLANGCLTG